MEMFIHNDGMTYYDSEKVDAEIANLNGIIDVAALEVAKKDAEIAELRKLLTDLADSVAMRTDGGLQGEWHTAMHYLEREG